MRLLKHSFNMTLVKVDAVVHCGAGRDRKKPLCGAVGRRGTDDLKVLAVLHVIFSDWLLGS